MTKKEAFETVFDELTRIDLFMGKYDAKHGDENLMYGISTVMEYIANQIDEKVCRDFEDEFVKNMIKSENKV